jgi:hypothetical protein
MLTSISETKDSLLENWLSIWEWDMVREDKTRRKPSKFDHIANLDAMFTALELHYITLIFKYCTTLPTSSFKFKDGEFQADKRKVKIYFRYLKSFLLGLNFLVLLSKFPSTLSRRHFPYIVMNGLETIIPIGVGVFQLSACLYIDDILALIKQTLTFNQKFGELIKMLEEIDEHFSHLQQDSFTPSIKQVKSASERALSETQDGNNFS